VGNQALSVHSLWLGGDLSPFSGLILGRMVCAYLLLQVGQYGLGLWLPTVYPHALVALRCPSVS
jgi:hypothetical protein